MADCYAVIWYDGDYSVVEWDIVAEDAIEHDARVTSHIIALIEDEDRDDFENIDELGLRGNEANADAVYICVAGPFANEVYAQMFIDEDVLDEDDDY